MKINWFPGHMNRARRELAQALRKIDVVIEVLDARLPQSSRNPMLTDLREGRPALVLLNREDLADPKVTQQWVETLLAQEGQRVLPISATDPRPVKRLQGLCKELAPRRRGPGKPVRCIVVGIPNVGKSTLINSLLGRRIAKVGDRPAVTQRQQRVQLERDVEVSDTPGLLWPKLADPAGAYRLAASGAIRNTAYELQDVAHFAAGFLAERYPQALIERYRLDNLPEQPAGLLEAIGRSRGMLGRGGVVDLERAAEVLLRELQAGTLGPISFETPEDFDQPPA